MKDSSPPGDAVAAERLSRLREEILRSSRSVREAELRSSLEMDIISSLVEGEKTITELVEVIFHGRGENPDFETQYMRVWRAAQDLASKGYLARRLFGKEKPYRITSYCVEMLLSGPGVPHPRLLAWLDACLYGLTVMLGILMVLVGRSILVIGGWGLLSFNSIFFFLLGISSLRMIQALRRVG